MEKQTSALQRGDWIAYTSDILDRVESIEFDSSATGPIRVNVRRWLHGRQGDQPAFFYAGYFSEQNVVDRYRAYDIIREWGASDNPFFNYPTRMPDDQGYHPYAVIADGGTLCEHCLGDPSNPVVDDRDNTQPDVKDEWSVVGFDSTGNGEDRLECDHCHRVLRDDDPYLIRVSIKQVEYRTALVEVDRDPKTMTADELLDAYFDADDSSFDMAENTEIVSWEEA